MSSHGLPGLAALTNHHTLEPFFANVWDKRPRLAPGKALPWLHRLLGLSAVEQLMASLPVPTQGFMSIVAGGAREPGKECQNAEGFVDLNAIHEHYRQGMSFVLTKMHKRHPFTGQMCRVIEADLISAGIVPTERVGANLYLTPPHAQALDPHFDFHHVLVIQLEGQKHWHVWSQHAEVNQPDHRGDLAKAALGSPVLEPVLQPGDVLYIPRGCPHEAQTTATKSLHLTLSMSPATWRDLLEETLADQTVLNCPLPAFYDGSDLGPLAELEILLHRGVAAAYQRSLEAFAMKLSPLPGAGFDQRHAPLQPSAHFKLLPGSLPILRTEAAQVHLTLQGARFSLPAKALAALQVICTGAVFDPQSLPDLSTQEAQTLVETLHRQGCLCPVHVHG